VIGLSHEANKMVGTNNQFKWYPLNAPATLETSGQGTVITEPDVEILFNSRVTRDIVFFKAAETMLPASGDTGAEHRISFMNYLDASQSFYVLNDDAFGLAKQPDKDEEIAYKLGQADVAQSSFDASKVGVSTFLIGAPNMFNPYGPNIDFYYRASFIDKWGNESAPSPLPSSGIVPLDSADDCVQLNFSESFFRFSNPDIKTIRLYRYGGDSSEFMFLRDIPMPDLAGFPLAIPESGTGFGGTWARKSSLSPFYLLKTYYDISSLGRYVNSNFDMTAAQSSLDGSWRINQLSENEPPNIAYTSNLSADTNYTDTTIELVSTTNPSAWPTEGVVKVGEEYIKYTGTTTTSLTGCTRGYYNTNAGTHKLVGSSAVNVVEWVLEIEHRNQDTTTLEEAIDSPFSSTEVVGQANSRTLTVAATDVFPASGKLLIGNEIYQFTGKTATTFTGVQHNTSGSIAATHSQGVRVLSYDENFSSISTVSNVSIEVNSFGYRDKARTPVMSLYSMQEDNWPPLGLTYNADKKQFFETESLDDYYRYIKAVGSMYFAALDANLKFSKYGTPEYWPLDAVVTLDSEIRAIHEHAGEGIVFTTNSVYRVRGTDPKAMIAFRVPDAKGLKAGDEHTVAEFNGGLLWLTASDGIAMYQAGRVSYLTRDKHEIKDLSSPYACVSDGVYWLFQKPGNGLGYRLEMDTGEIRLAQTSIEAYYAYFAKALGKSIVVTKDDAISDDTIFTVEEIGGKQATNIKWKSKKIDGGEPAIPKAFGSLAIVYEGFNSKSSTTIVDGIRGQALVANLLGLDPADLDAGDIASGESTETTDLYDIYTKYDQPDQTFIIDVGGTDLTDTERRTIVMQPDFVTSTVTVGDRIWNELFADNTVVESIGTAIVDSITYPAIVLDKEPLRTGTGNIYWGNLPLVEIYINEEDTPSRTFTLPPGDTVEPQSMDLYLNDLKRFRTVSVAIQGDLRVQTLSLRHYPLQSYQSQTLHHSADVFYKGEIDFRVMLDGNLIYRKELNNAGDDFKEERVYLPASSYGQRVHYMNESRSGMIESVKFNGSLAA
jgi:hypothetical protein